MTCRAFLHLGWPAWPATRKTRGAPSWPTWRPRRVATLVAFIDVLTSSARDDVIDIFDVVFGDLQRSATSRGQRRRTAELRDYDRAVGELRTAMGSVLDALDDEMAIAAVLVAIREVDG